jgi:hypothetical protein
MSAQHVRVALAELTIQQRRSDTLMCALDASDAADAVAVVQANGVVQALDGRIEEARGKLRDLLLRSGALRGHAANLHDWCELYTALLATGMPSRTLTAEEEAATAAVAAAVEPAPMRGDARDDAGVDAALAPLARAFFDSLPFGPQSFVPLKTTGDEFYNFCCHLGGL